MDIYRVFTPHTRLLVVSGYNYKKCKVITLLTGVCLDLGLPHIRTKHITDIMKIVCHNKQTSKWLHETAWIYMLFKLEVMTHHLVVRGSSLHSHCYSLSFSHVSFSWSPMVFFWCTFYLLGSPPTFPPWTMSLYPSGLGAVMQGNFQNPPRPGSQLPYHSPHLCLEWHWVGYMWMRNKCAISSTCVLKTFDYEMFDNGEEEQAVTSIKNKYKNF
jgi:hypothetical protein